MEQTVKLQIENQQLKERLEHLEDLLKNAPMEETALGILVKGGMSGLGIGGTVNSDDITVNHTVKDWEWK